MLKSMTGYGKSEYWDESNKIFVEIKTVNNRYCDFNIRIPRGLHGKEFEIRKILAKNIARGKIDFFLDVESNVNNKYKLILNETLLNQYLDLWNKIKEKFSLSGSLNISNIFELKEVILLEKIPEELNERELNLIVKTIEKALEQLEGMRTKEGFSLCEDITNRLKKIEEDLAKIESLCSENMEIYNEKILKKIESFKKDLILDENRILQEFFFLVEKSDITEEIVRTKSHLNQIYTCLNTNSPVGRKMEFLLQEINREINVIGAKSNKIDIGKLVIEIKGELEKIREQVQNIE
jgi:uncharacterized protein (TIGR00255 family)